MKDFKMEAFVVFTREETTDPEELATYLQASAHRSMATT
jgi:hypothetical protein